MLSRVQKRSNTPVGGREAIMLNTGSVTSASAHALALIIGSLSLTSQL